MPELPEGASALRPGRPGAPLTKLKPGPGRPPAEVADHQRIRIQRATIQLAAERGYDAPRVRDIASLAGVSTKTFYRHFRDKEHALQAALELCDGRMRRRLAVQLRLGRSADAPGELRRILETVVGECEEDPQAARFLLVEARAAGPEASKRAQSLGRSLVSAAAGGLDPRGAESPASRRIVKGVAAGITSVLRSRLADGSVEGLRSAIDPLVRWACSCTSPTALDLCRMGAELRSALLFGEVTCAESKMEVPSGDRFLLLNAVVRLALEEGRDGLTVRKILAASGVSRRSFNLNFSDLEDCLSVALEWKVERALFRARLAGGAAGTQMGGVIRALASLGDQIVSDRMFAELCFGEPAISGGAMRCRDRFLLDVSDLVRALGLDQLQAEATAGAIWGVASKQAGARNRVHRDLGVVVTLPYLALAPAMGGSAAIRAVCDEVSKTVQKKNNRQNRGWDHGQKIIDPGRNAA